MPYSGIKSIFIPIVITAKKTPSKSIPKSKDSKRKGGSKTENRDRSDNSDFKVDKQKRKE